jgi:hypothetical protein
MKKLYIATNSVQDSIYSNFWRSQEQAINAATTDYDGDRGIITMYEIIIAPIKKFKVEHKTELKEYELTKVKK